MNTYDISISALLRSLVLVPRLLCVFLFVAPSHCGVICGRREALGRKPNEPHLNVLILPSHGTQF